MPYILPLEEVTRENKIAGHKAAILGDMLRSGLPVPTGFVITTEAFEFFLRFNKLEERISHILQNLDFENIDGVKQKSKEIEDLIMNAEFTDTIRRSVKDFYENMGVGKEARLIGGAALDIIRAGRERTFVSVRSSIPYQDPQNSSFAGQLVSFLNISGTDRLLEAVKKCWAYYFNPRILFYRKNKNLPTEFKIAILIQKMLEPEKSGIALTADPLSSDKGKILIEASYGLGQSIASGLIIPDRYLLDKNTNQITEKIIGKKSILIRKDQIGKTIVETVGTEKANSEILLETEIPKIIELSKRIENLYGGQPQDIEWCIERGRIFVTQSRPMTALAKEIAQQFNSITTPIITGNAASKGSSIGKIKNVNTLDHLSKISSGDIIVAKTASPDFMPYLSRISGLITDEGGLTSNFAIIAREVGLPFITGTSSATQTLKEGQEIIMDAFSGSICLSEQSIQEKIYPIPQNPVNENVNEKDSLTATELNLNLSLPDQIENLQIIDAFAPLSIENMFLETGKNPAYLARTAPQDLISMLIEKIGKVAASCKKPVWYKCIDLKTEEFHALEGSEEEVREPNPFLGRRGIRASLDNQEVLKCELKALKLLKENSLQNTNLLLPFVTNPEEIISVKNQLDFPLKLGIIAETPACILDLENICKPGVDFVLIGLDNLAQLTLGVDRSNPSISHLYSETHKAVSNLIEKAVDTCKKLKIKSGIFGDAIDTPELIEKLVEFGIDSISVNPSSLNQARTHIIRTEKKILLEKLRKEAKGT